MNKPKILKITGIIGFSMITTLLAVIQVNKWFEKNKFFFQWPLQLTLHKPIQIVERELLRPQIIEVVNELPQIKDLTPIEEYICDTFGPYDCRLALAVFSAESNLREDAYNCNSNGSLDLGPAQINSVHWEKEGCGLQDLVDPYKNIECAKQIYDASGFGAWTVFKNGAFKSKL